MAKKYLLGLDLGTSSVGWCLVDENNDVIHKGGKSLWGVRLFDEAESKKSRRSYRAQRRRNDRKQWRLTLLQSLFQEEMKKVDSNFFKRMNYTFYQKEDKPDFLSSEDGTLFANVGGLSDKEVFRKYKAIYHLRKRLQETALDETGKPFDLRLVYLALHHAIKHRGNFLYTGNFNVEDPSIIREELQNILECAQEIIVNDVNFKQVEDSDSEKLIKIYCEKSGLNDRKKKIKIFLEGLFKDKKSDSLKIIAETISTLIAGSKLGRTKTNEFFKLYDNEIEIDEGLLEYKFNDEETEEKLVELSSLYGELPQCKIINSCYRIFSFLNVINFIGDSKNVSEAMIKIYEKHQRDLKDLKRWIKENTIFDEKSKKEKYRLLFRTTKIELENKCNYAQYVGKNIVNGCAEKANFGVGAKRGQRELYDFLKKTIFEKKDEKEIKKEIDSEGISSEQKEFYEQLLQFYEDMEKNNFLPKARSSSNGILPYQLHKNEVEKIIEVQGENYPFLKDSFQNKKGETEYKITSLLKFKVPYYVGPLIPHMNDEETPRNVHAWAFFKNYEKGITPWNFHDKVDTDKSAEKFIKRMTSKCTYLPDQECLPKKSLLYSFYEVASFLNEIAINGKALVYDSDPITTKEIGKKQIIDGYFKKEKKPSIKSFNDFLARELGADYSSELLTYKNKSDNPNSLKEIPCSLSSYIDFKEILKERFENSFDMVEKIINDLAVFEDREIVARRLIHKYGFNEKTDKEIIDKICRLSYSKFGNLSREFLKMPLHHLIDAKNGVIDDKETSVLELILKEGMTIPEILSDNTYDLTRKVEERNEEVIGDVRSKRQVKKYIDDMYVSPIMKRPMYQAYKIIKELEKIIGHHIDEYYVETTRGHDKNKETKDNRLSFLISKLEKAQSDKNHDVPVPEGNKLLDDFIRKLKEDKKREEYLKYRSKRLYLYNMQLGKCLYSMETITNYDSSDYEIDHIVPRADVVDNSIDNLVLVKKEKNTSKADHYPIPNGILAEGAQKFHRYLYEHGLISEKKYNALKRKESEKLTDKEKEAFVNRQLVSTSQATIGLIDLLKKFERTDSGGKPRIVYSSAKLVSDFRNKFKLLKARDANNLHHAHDAYLNIIVGRAVSARFGYPRCIWDKLNEYEINKDGKKVKITLNPLRIFEEKKRGIFDSDGFLVWSNLKHDESKTILKVKKRLYKCKDILITKKVCTSSDIFAETSLKSKGKYPIRNMYNGEPFELDRYGGYGSLRCNYFSIIERQNSKKGSYEFLIVPIPKIKVPTVDEKLIFNYCCKLFDSENIKIIRAQVPLNSLFQVGKTRFLLTSNDDSKRVNISSANEIFFDKDTNKTIHNISKFINILNKIFGKDVSGGYKSVSTAICETEEGKGNKFLYRKDKKILIISYSKKSNNSITLCDKELIRLMKYLIDKAKLYEDFPLLPQYKFLVGLKDKELDYDKLEVWEKALVVSQVLRLLRAFNDSKTDVEINASNFTLKPGRQKMSKRALNNYPNVKLISQSITGYYEKTIWSSGEAGKK